MVSIIFVISVILMFLLYIYSRISNKKIKIGDVFEQRTYGDLVIQITEINYTNKKVEYKLISIYGKDANGDELYTTSIKVLNEIFEKVK